MNLYVYDCEECVCVCYARKHEKFSAHNIWFDQHSYDMCQKMDTFLHISSYSRKVKHEWMIHLCGYYNPLTVYVTEFCSWNDRNTNLYQNLFCITEEVGKSLFPFNIKYKTTGKTSCVSSTHNSQLYE